MQPVFWLLQLLIAIAYATNFTYYPTNYPTIIQNNCENAETCNNDQFRLEYFAKCFGYHTCSNSIIYGTEWSSGSFSGIDSTWLYPNDNNDVGAAEASYGRFQIILLPQNIASRLIAKICVWI